MRNILLFLLLAFNSFAGTYVIPPDIDSTKIARMSRVVFYSSLTTNYYYKTNFVEAYYRTTYHTNINEYKSGVLRFPREVEMIGLIFSNHICEVYYKNKLTSSNVLDSVEISRMVITREWAYKTNYFEK